MQLFLHGSLLSGSARMVLTVTVTAAAAAQPLPCQAVLRAIFGYFMAVPLDTVPRLDIPLHTLIGESSSSTQPAATSFSSFALLHEKQGCSCLCQMAMLRPQTQQVSSAMMACFRLYLHASLIA